MTKKFTDLSQLTKAVLRKDAPKEVPAVAVAAEPAAPSREEAECLNYFSHTSLTDPRFATAGRKLTSAASRRSAAAASVSNDRTLEELTKESKRLVAEADELRKAFDEADGRAKAAERALEGRQEEARTAEARCARLEAEIRTLRQQLEKEAPTVIPAEEVQPVQRSAAPQAVNGLLTPPKDFAETFPGEVREMVVSALHDACQTARQGTRDRRAAVLEAVLAANPSSGELERRRSELRQILKDAAYFNDEHMLKGLEKLGMKLISGRKHWKLEYGNVRMPMSKTPSDYRSSLNSSADMANRCF